MGETTVAIIQARTGSTRLPGKVMEEIAGEPMLWHVVRRAHAASLLDRVVVATSTEPGDDRVADFCDERGFDVFRGSETDVLARYHRAAREYDADVVVRITSDCPLVSPPTIDRVVRTFDESAVDYVANNFEPTYPHGLDVECFKMDALREAHLDAQTEEDREHVTPYLRRTESFERINVENVVDLSRYRFFEFNGRPRLTVDYPEDLELVRAVFEALAPRGGWLFDQLSVFELFEREPSLLEINEEHV